VNNTLISILKEKNEREILQSDELSQKLREMENSIQYMSRTIDDFMHFYHPHKEKITFSVSKVVEHALEITHPMLNKANIEIRFKSSDGFYVNGYMNEYMQVLISILTNAKDTLSDKEIKDAYIQIDLLKTDDNIVLKISDNAGGINEEHMHRIFDPYFTTKHKSMGTGLGLYISKMIIEKNMNGILSVENTKEGATFSITMEKADD
jgi:C4-dicarboxylate-specific signal transduction histidine kinase